MAMIVMKFGGSSVGSIGLIQNIAEKIALHKRSQDQLVLVVSAMASTTDELWEMAHTITARPNRREMDMLLTAGERISMSMLSLALQEYNLEAISFTGSQSGIITDERHGNARIINVNAFRILDEVKKDRIAIVAGFQGVSQVKEITTLGRGGSDTSAVALAGALKADKCEIYTDVAGVYTADPRVVAGARLLPQIGYDTMLALAYGGSRVIHPRAVEFALKYQIPVEIKSSFSFQPGTLLINERNQDMETRKIEAIAHKENLIRYTLHKDTALQQLLQTWDFEIFRYSVEGDRLELIVEAKYESEIDYHLSTASISPLAKEPNLGYVIPVGIGINLDPAFLAVILELCQDIQLIKVSHSERSIELLLPTHNVQECLQRLHHKFLGENK
ncbi:MAG: aspartate kinase [Candidatus Cloacimonetes bacterium]|nr:aspartate kinase [Candidatus Cloacimonadota bacterium]NLO12384.1 aspartate kinase [Candidatus Cloacimonadota bacterium]